MKTLTHGVWNSCISLPTKIRLYNVYIIPVIMCDADVWSLTVASQRCLDAFDQWCPYISNSEMDSRTGQPPITTLIKQR